MRRRQSAFIKIQQRFFALFNALKYIDGPMIPRAEFQQGIPVETTTQASGHQSRASQTVEAHQADLKHPSFAISAWCMSKRKRIFDLCVSIPAIVVLAPLMAVVACAIKLTSEGPALFCQERIGLHQKPFVILKFRTMIHASKSGVMNGLTVTKRGDARLTSLGAILRRLKLDELPQLINVIRGEMSLVGPRPKLAEHEKMYLSCRPGITGAATIVFSREESILAEVPEEFVENYTISVLNPVKIELDSRYLETASLAADLRILAGTFFRSRNAPEELPRLKQV